MLHALPLVGVIARLAAFPVAYWVLWFASLALSVALVVLLRIGWGKNRPLHKCAVLSMLVHLLLAWGAMTVRIVAGEGDGDGQGIGPAIRVRVVNEPMDGPMVAALPFEAPALAAAPELLEAPVENKADPPKEVPVAKEDKPPASEPAAKPVVAEPKVEKPVVADVKPPPTTPDAPKLVDAGQNETVPKPSPAPKPADVATTPEEKSKAVPVAALPVAPPGAATPYSLRDAPGRLGLVEQQGGSGQTETAVGAALRWLAAAQSRDGRWDADEYGSGQEQMVLNQNRGGAGRNADTAITALALLAFLGSGHSHIHGDYQDTVRGGIDFLLRSQADDGSLCGESTLYAQMYCHAMATFALAEAQAMTGDRRLEAAVEKAINFSIAAQNNSTGGWRYRPGDTGDTSQLGWQVMALTSARRAGIDVPANTWARVERFLGMVRRGNSGGLASYRADSPASTSMTAEALYCRLLLADTFGNRVDEAAAEEATNNLLASLPNAERVNLYYWYYATLALHHRFPQNERAAEAWRTWNDAMTTAIVSTQLTSGEEAGSWDTNTMWGGYGGRVYTTAMATMCLEVYYRYAPPATPATWTAERPRSEDMTR